MAHFLLRYDVECLVGVTSYMTPATALCGAVAGDMHLVPKKDHCNTGCNLDTKTINDQGASRKGIFHF